MFIEIITNKKIPDINSGFRIFDKLNTTNYFPKLCNTFSFTTSQTLNYLLDNRRVGYAEIEYNQRCGKSKVKFIKDSFITIKYVLINSFYYKPYKTVVIILSILLFLFCTLFFLICILL